MSRPMNMLEGGETICEVNGDVMERIRNPGPQCHSLLLHAHTRRLSLFFGAGNTLGTLRYASPWAKSTTRSIPTQCPHPPSRLGRNQQLSGI
jgi:hypothetical protein